jgi:hypothetical protein
MEQVRAADAQARARAGRKFKSWTLTRRGPSG